MRKPRGADAMLCVCSSLASGDLSNEACGVAVMAHPADLTKLHSPLATANSVRSHRCVAPPCPLGPTVPNNQRRARKIVAESAH